MNDLESRLPIRVSEEWTDESFLLSGPRPSGVRVIIRRRLALNTTRYVRRWQGFESGGLYHLRPRVDQVANQKTSRRHRSYDRDRGVPKPVETPSLKLQNLGRSSRDDFRTRGSC